MNLFEKMEEARESQGARKLIHCDVDGTLLSPSCVDSKTQLELNENLHRFLIWARDEQRYDVQVVTGGRVDKAKEKMLDLGVDPSLADCKSKHEVSHIWVALTIDDTKPVYLGAMYWNPLDKDVQAYLAEHHGGPDIAPSESMPEPSL